MGIRIPLEQPEKMNPLAKAMAEKWNAAVTGPDFGYIPTAKLEAMRFVVEDAMDLVSLPHAADCLKEAGFVKVAEDGMETNHRGAITGKMGLRYDLIPPDGLKAIAEVMTPALAEHGGDPDNWRKLDRADQVNHALCHILEYKNGNTDEPHLRHALCRLLFACSVLQEDLDASALLDDMGIGEAPPPKPSRDFQEVYISHAFKGDPEGNTIMAMQFARALAPNQTAHVPHLMFRYLDEAHVGRDVLMEHCKRAVSTCDLFILCGKEITKGMEDEWDVAIAHGIPCYRWVSPSLSKIKVDRV